MKQSEKLDLILQTLYQYRNEDKYYAMSDIVGHHNLAIEPGEWRRLLTKLKDERLIKAEFTFDDSLVQITSDGIEYCEEDSFNHKGSPIVHNHISNSPNANIVSQSSQTTITITNNGNIKNKIQEIREAVNNNSALSQAEKKEFKECIEEVETSVEAGKKPKFALKSLLEMASSFAGIGSLVTDLIQLF
jgi:hypothetical protein